MSRVLRQETLDCDVAYMYSVNVQCTSTSREMTRTKALLCNLHLQLDLVCDKKIRNDFSSSHESSTGGWQILVLGHIH